MEKFELNKNETNTNDDSNQELTTEAIEHMSHSLESIKPVISEQELRSICEGSDGLEMLLESFLKYSVRYANDVWSMEKLVADGGLNTEDGIAVFADMDEARTILHNALVDSIAILSRNIAKEGKDNSWVRELTNGHELQRVACGKFALLTIYRRYIDNRQNI
jgi:hypothetical protein